VTDSNEHDGFAHAIETILQLGQYPSVSSRREE
jgi:hypothetical protein